MRKFVRPLLALSLATLFGVGAQAYGATTGFATDSYASQLNYDSFNLSVRKRMETLRIGSLVEPFGRAPVNSDPYNYQVGSATLGSDAAYAMAPSSRVASSSAYRRRQLDCVYYSGFTVWADMYQTWARQRSDGYDDGYRHRVFGPAVGFDYTTGGFTIGAATTYSWGKLKSRNWDHDRKTRTWALELYGQYNTDLFYINGTLGYGHNRFRSSRSTAAGSKGDRYNTNSWNIDSEFGWKFNFGGLQVVPHAGLRYFHDRRGSISEGTNWLSVQAGSRNFHVLEMPMGVNLAYEINTGGMIFVPRARLGWIPELSRKRGSVSGYYYTDNAGNAARFHQGSERNRHNFNLGLGLEAKITKSISAHIDYNAYLRSDLYEHHWNFGAGFSF